MENFAIEETKTKPAMGSQGKPKEGFNKCVLVTRGTGFIRSHTALQLLENGCKVYIIDNLDNSVEETVNRVRDLVDQQFSQNLHFFWGIFATKRM